MGTVFAISVGAERGPKKVVDRAFLRENHGVEGDCHAGPGSRQVSLIAWEDVVALRQNGINAKPGDFAENLAIEGIDFTEILPGSKLEVGTALLEISEIGKPEWEDGDYSFEGIALVARSGFFARVVRGGWIRPGDLIKVV